MITIPALSADAYYGILRKLLAASEDDIARPYVDTVGKTTIGRGFMIEGSGDQKTIREIVFRTMGINPAAAGLTAAQQAAEQSYLNQLAAAVNGATTPAVQAAMDAVMAKRAADPLFANMPGVTSRTTFAMSSTEIESAFRSIIQTIFEKRVTRLVGTSLPDSKEKAALISMSYLGTLDGRTAARIKGALAGPSNLRAEAWFTIRYYALDSYRQRANATAFETNRNGYAKRLYVESQLFGLYDNPAAVSADEAKQVYKMLSLHRGLILQHESLYGEPPDGTSATRRDAIALANSDPRLTAVATVQKLQTMLEPARDAFIAWVNTVLPAGVPALTKDSWNAAAIFYNGIRGDATDASVDPSLDARSLDGKGNGMDKNLMVGETGANQMYGGKGADTLIGRDKQDWLDGGADNDILVGGDGDDTLIGGTGNDTLYGGKGNDLYIWNTGDGTDKIIETRDADGKIHGRIKINGGPEQELMGGAFVETSKGSNEYYNAATGVTLTHHSPWTLVLADGSTIQLGENQEDFQDGDFGIHLVEAKDTTFTPDRVINGDLQPVDFDPKTAGIQTRTDDLDNVIVSSTPAPGRNDFLYDSAGNDQINGGAGIDYIEAYRGGNDKLDGGADRDIVLGRGGDDIVIGGDGSDIMRGDSGKDSMYAGAETTLDAALKVQDAAPSGQQGDFMDGGTEDDLLIGDTGNDALNGGLGDDIIVGGAGDDEIHGDLETSEVNWSWSITREVIKSDTGTTYKTTYNNVDFVNPTAGGDDVIYAGAGADWVRAGYGDDYVDGGTGDDVLFGQAGNDDLLGGDGNDVVVGDGADIPDSEHGDDYLDGGNGDDELEGMGGNDSLFGGDGADRLYGGTGDDYLDGEAGDDQALGGAGADQLFGGDGNDTLQGDSGSGVGDGDDYLDGEGGNDLMFGEGGSDTMFGGDGDDQLQGGDGNDELHGDAGNDLMFGEDGDDTMDGDAGDDQLQGGAGDDIVSGGDGNDLIFGEDGNDTLYGDAGDDELQGGLGDDVLDGGDGVNKLFGEEGNDTLVGGDGTNYFIGGTGDDTMIGGSGNDVFYYSLGDGFDHITDAGGTDWVVFTDISVGMVVLGVGSLKLTMPDGGELHLDDFDPDNPLDGQIEYFQFSDAVLSRQQLLDMLGFKITGTPGEDDLTGTALGDTILAYDSNDTVNAGDGDDNVDLGGGDDFASAGAGDDTVAGGAGNDYISGGDGNDLLDGGDGDDRLDGDAGADRLFGGAGNDTLAGGAGNDELHGDAGNDTYEFGAGDGQDVVIDGAGANAVRLTGGLTESAVTLRKLGSDLVVEVNGTSDRLTVKDWFSDNGAGWTLALGDGTVLDRAGVDARLVKNSAPVLGEDSAKVTEDVVLQVAGNALANDADPEGRALRVTSTGTFKGQYGTLTIDSNGAYTYQLDAAKAEVQALAQGQVVTDRFAYTATDDDPAGAASASSQIVISITGTNDAPVLDPSFNNASEDGLVRSYGNVLDNAHDVDAGTVLQVRPGVYTGTYGTLTLATDGSYVYELNNESAAVQSLADGQRVDESFSYLVTDGYATASATLNLEIYGANDAPVLVTELPDQSVGANSAYSWQIPAGTWKDIDQGAVLSYSARLADGSDLPSWLAFDATTATFSGRVPRDATGYLDIEVTVTDGDPNAGAQEGYTPVSDVFRLDFSAKGGGGGGGTGGSKGNEGVGNGEDPPPPGHDTNQNDGPGTSPGNPGSKSGNGRPDKSAGATAAGVPHLPPGHLDSEVSTGVKNNSGLSGKKEQVHQGSDSGKRKDIAPSPVAALLLPDGHQSGAVHAAPASPAGPSVYGTEPALSLDFADPSLLQKGTAAPVGDPGNYVERWAAMDRELSDHLALSGDGALLAESGAGAGAAPLAVGTLDAPGQAAAHGKSGDMAQFTGLAEGFRKVA